MIQIQRRNKYKLEQDKDILKETLKLEKENYLLELQIRNQILKEQLASHNIKEIYRKHDK